MGSDISSKLNQLTSCTIFPTKPIFFESTKTTSTEQCIFDSSATNAFYQPSTTLVWKIPGKHPIIHAIQPDGSTPHDTNITIQPAANGNILANLWHHSILSMGHFSDAGCTVTFTKSDAVILYKEQVVLQGIQHSNGLWNLDTQTFNAPNQHHQQQGLNDITSVHTTKCLQHAL